MKINEIESIELEKGEAFKDLLGRWVTNPNKPLRDLGKLKGYEIVQKSIDPKNWILFAVLNKDRKPVGFLEISKDDEDDEFAWKTGYVGFSKELQGTGIAPLLYAFVMKKTGYVFRSDSMQSKGGKSIWRRLAQIPGVLVFAWSPREKKGYNIDPETLTSDEIGVYDTDLDDDEHYQALDNLYHKLGNAMYKMGYEKKDTPEYQKLEKEEESIYAEMQKYRETHSAWKANEIYLVATVKK